MNAHAIVCRTHRETHFAAPGPNPASPLFRASPLVLSGCFRAASVTVLAVALLGVDAQVRGADGPSLPAIQKVEIRDRAFHVNGQPFFPVMAWLQDTGNLPLLKECAFNSTAGYTRGERNATNVVQYLQEVERAGLYGVMPYEEGLKGQPALLAYIHDDEPDLTSQVSDAQVLADRSLRLNPSTPLWKLLDGDLSSWSVLDPLAGATFTIKVPKPVTIESLAVVVTVSKGLSVARRMVFDAGGQTVLSVTLSNRPGVQKFNLPKPATFSALTVRVASVTPGTQEWGSLGEIQGFDHEGKNVLLSPLRRVPRAWPEESARKYRVMKDGDPTRPVFMTLTGNFHPLFKHWTEEQRTTLYPRYIEASDVVGYDIYPIYGWNKPEWLYLGHEATERLVQLAGPRPVYAWIETSKGGQWTGALENQKDVTPDHIAAEVWMCICRGATAIGYFTHIWKPQYAQFGVPEENRRALTRINRQITRLTPAILGQAVPEAVAITSAEAVKLDVLARRVGTELYLFTVNYDERQKPAHATLKVPGLVGGKKVVVVDENRTLETGAGGLIADTFNPLEVHIYRMTAP